MKTRDEGYDTGKKKESVMVKLKLELKSSNNSCINDRVSESKNDNFNS